MTASPPFPRYDGSTYVPADSVGYQLMMVMLAMKREVEQRMQVHALTDAQWRPLWLIKNGLATTPCEIARLSGIDAGATTRMLDRLQAKGLLARERSGSDRRVVQLALTAAGEAAVREVPNVLAEVNNAFLHDFTEAEWQQLHHLLGRMLANGARPSPAASAAAAATVTATESK